MPWKVLRRGVPSRVLLVVNAALLVVNGSVLVVNATLLVVNGSVPLCFNHGATFFELHKQKKYNLEHCAHAFQWLPKAIRAQRETQSPHRKSKAPPQRVYLQRSSLPTRDDACRGPPCRPESIPAEVVSAHPR